MKKAVLLIACMASASYADVLYSNITGPNIIGPNETGAFVTNGRVDVWQASAFTPASDATFTSASARLLNLYSAPGIINFALYDSDAASGLPGSSLATLGAVTLAGSQEGVFTLSASSPLSLLANVQYWLVLSPGRGGRVGVVWEAASIGGGYGEHPAANFNTLYVKWVADTSVFTQQFAINGTPGPAAVPEPSSTWMVPLGALGIACLLLKRRSQRETCSPSRK